MGRKIAWAVGLLLLAAAAARMLGTGGEAVRLARKSNEGDQTGNLGAIRSALSVYYGDMAGAGPARLEALTVAGKYLAALPQARPPDYHSGTSAVRAFSAEEYEDLRLGDEGGWGYVAASTDAARAVFVNCTHTDTKGSVWARY